jgi:Flp pilus assembly protein TadB
MTSEPQIIPQVSPEMERKAAQAAKIRARVARWDLDIAVFLFGVLLVVIMLLFQGFGVEIVAPVAVLGLLVVWVLGWQRGKRLYRRFYTEELLKLEQMLMEPVAVSEETVDETIEDVVRKALRRRLLID